MNRQPDFATQQRPPRRPAGEWFALALAALALVASAAAAWLARSEAAEAHAHLAEVRRSLAQESLRAERLASVVEAVAGGAAASSVPPARVVAGLEAVLPPGARLRALSIDYGPSVSLEMQVEARGAAAWDRLLEGLERSADFRDVAPGPESRQAEVKAKIRARWAGGRP